MYSSTFIGATAWDMAAQGARPGLNDDHGKHGLDGGRPSPSAAGTGGSLGAYVRRLLVLLLVVAAAAVGVVALRVLCVVFAGVLLGVFLYRLSDEIRRRSPLPYPACFAVVMTLLVGLFAGAGTLAVPRLGAQLRDLSSRLMASLESIVRHLQELGWVNEVAREAPDLGGRLLGSLDAASLLGGVFSSAAAALTAAFLIVFVGCFLAFDPGLYRRGFLLLVPPRHRRRADELLRISVDTLWWWTLGRLVAMAIVGAATAIGLRLLGVPLAFTLGALAGLVSFVPTVGAVLAILPALLVALQQGPWMPVYVLVLYLAVQAVENNLITPFVQQEAVSVPPVILAVSQILMGVLVGLVGVAIATPVAALVIRLVRETYVQQDSPGLELPPERLGSGTRAG